MAVKNNICLDCEHSTLCKIEDKIVIFLDDAKKPLGVNITINDCKNFKKI